jgi:hypothetical protein
MMKKTVAAMIVASFAGVAGLANAADNAVTQLSSGTYVENTSAGCSLLRDRVTVNLSNGVTAVYNCMVTAVKVNVGACHSSGSQKPTDITCAATGSDANGNPIFNDSSCTAAGQLTTPKQTFSISGRRGYTGSTTGGSVSATNLNATTCTTTALGSLTGISQ